MLFITHAMPKNLQVDEIVRIGQGALHAVAADDETKHGVVGGVRMLNFIISLSVRRIAGVAMQDLTLYFSFKRKAA